MNCLECCEMSYCVRSGMQVCERHMCEVYDDSECCEDYVSDVV